MASILRFVEEMKWGEPLEVQEMTKHSHKEVQMKWSFPSKGWGKINSNGVVKKLWLKAGCGP